MSSDRWPILTVAFTACLDNPLKLITMIEHWHNMSTAYAKHSSTKIPNHIRSPKLTHFLEKQN